MIAAFMLVINACNEIPLFDSIELDEPLEPTLTLSADLPELPAVALHIVEREYFSPDRANGRAKQELLWEEYLGKRLLELYPDIISSGMIEQAQAEIETLKVEYEGYLKELRGYEESIGADTIPDEEYRPFTTLKEEIEFTQMTPGEIELFYELEALATSDTPITRDDLDNITGIAGGRTKEIPFVVGIAGSLSSVGYATFRIIQSKNRAEDKAEEYYPENTDSGRKGDAFRHIFVSVLLRRYLTRTGSWIVMGAVEKIRKNEPRDRQMDFHNNYIGRVKKYRSFRGRWLRDRWNWKKWGRSVRDFVNNANNGVKMNWDSNPPSTQSDAENQLDDVSSKKYVWYEG